jgi:hypothetical protein
MSHFEFIISGDVTPEFDGKIKQVLDNMNTGRAVYGLQKYVDEDVSAEKKRRTLVLVSPMNVWNHLYDIFKGCGLEFQVYHKQRII